MRFQPAALRARRDLRARTIGEDLLERRRAVLADVARLGREDDERLAVGRHDDVGVAVHDLEPGEVRDAALESAVLAARDDQRVEVVRRHGGARVGVAALELAGEIHQVVVSCVQDASMPRTSAAMVSLSGVGTPSRAPKRDDAAVQVVDLGAPARLDVLEHAGLVVVGHLGPGRVIDQGLGIGVEGDALSARDGLALVDQAADERAQVGALADAPVREARERAERIRGRVEDDLAPLRRARVGDGVGRHARPRAGVGQALDLVHRRRLRLERPERRVALDVPLHDAGLEQLAGREGRAADHALDVARERLLVADAVHDRGHGTVGEGVRGRQRSRTRRASPWSRRCRARTAAAPPGRSWHAGRACTSPAPRQPQAVRVDRVDVRLREIEGPHLDVVERGEIGREQRPDRAAADDADPHGAVPSGADGRRAAGRRSAGQ